MYIDGIEVIKAFGKTESSYAKFTKAVFESAEFKCRLTKISAFLEAA